MTDLLSPNLDFELFGDSQLVQLDNFFDPNTFVGFDMAATGFMEAGCNVFNDDTLEHADSSSIGALEYPGGLQGSDWDDLLTFQESEKLPADAEEEGLSASPAAVVCQATPSMKDAMAEIARLNTLVDSMQPSLVPAQTKTAPQTPPKRRSHPKTPQMTLRNRVTKASPRNWGPMSPEALAISKRVGPIEAMWGSDRSQEQYMQDLFANAPQGPLKESVSQDLPSERKLHQVLSSPPYLAVNTSFVSAQTPQSPSQVNTQADNDDFNLDATFPTNNRNIDLFGDTLTTVNNDYSNEFNDTAFAPDFQTTGPAANISSAPIDNDDLLFLSRMNEGMSASQYTTSSPTAVLPSDDDLMYFTNMSKTMSLPQIPTSSPAAMASNNGASPQNNKAGVVVMNGAMYAPVVGSSSDPIEIPTFTAQSSPVHTSSLDKQPKKPRAPSKPRAKRSPAATSPATKAAKKVTKAAHKRNSSVPAPAAISARKRSLSELCKLPFFTLSESEKAQVLLPLFQGYDPETGRYFGKAGTLVDQPDFEAMGEDVYHRFVVPRHQAQVQTQAQAQVQYQPPVQPQYQPQFQTQVQPQFPIQVQSGFDLAQQAAAELGMDAGAQRQQEALQRAEWLKQQGRRR